MASAAGQAIAQVRTEHVRAVNTTDVDLFPKGSGTISLDDGPPTDVNLAYLLVYRLHSDHGWRISHDISTPGPA